MAVLTVERVSKYFGGIAALDDVSLEVHKNELVALIGPNGSGKTTLFNCITGELAPDRGAILANGTNIVGWPVHRIARLGFIRTYQQIEVFPKLTVRENLLLAGQEHQGDGLLPSLFRTPRVRMHETGLATQATEITRLLGLVRQAEERAGDLSYGQRKVLAIGMALMDDPALLLLDEPLAAVNPTAIEHIIAVLLEAKARGHTIVLVEHNLPVVMRIAERIIVLNGGKKLVEGPPEIVRKDPRVIEAYFGG